MKKIYLLLAACLILTGSCDAQFSQSRLNSKIEQHLKEKHIPGAMVSIVRGDSILFVGGFGLADLESEETVTADHLFRQGSVSKSFTALGLLKALKNSAYELETPIREIDATIPFENAWEAESPVRIVHLLEHTTGFDDMHLHAMYNTEDEEVPPVRNIVVDHQNSLTSRWEPGTKYTYSNPGYVLAGHLLEEITGQRYSDYLEQEILRPIGLQSAGFFFNEPQEIPHVQGYQHTGSGNHRAITFTRINGGPAGEMSASANDMAIYLQYMLRRGNGWADSTLFTEQEFDRIEYGRTSLAAKKGLKQSYGLGNYPIWKNGYFFNGHGGAIDGFASRYVYSREADLGVAVAINRQGNATAIVNLILEEILGKEVGPPAGRKTLPIPREMADQFAGFYEFNSPRNEFLAFNDRMLAGLIIDFEEDFVVTRSILGKARDTLYHAGEARFYKNNEGEPTTLFFKDENGEPGLWINENYTEMASRPKRLVLFFGLLISIVMLLSFAAYALIWLIVQAFRRRGRPIANHVALLLAGLSFLGVFLGFGLALSDPTTAGQPNFYNLLMYVSSFALILFTGLSVWRFFKLDTGKGFKWYYGATTISALWVAVFLIDIGFVGFKLWAY